MPGTSQSTVYFSSCKPTPLSDAGNTLINTDGRSELPYFKDCFRLLQEVQYIHFIKVALQQMLSALAILRDEAELALGTKRVKIDG